MSEASSGAVFKLEKYAQGVYKLVMQMTGDKYYLEVCKSTDCNPKNVGTGRNVIVTSQASGGWNQLFKWQDMASRNGIKTGRLVDKYYGLCLTACKGKTRVCAFKGDLVATKCFDSNERQLFSYDDPDDTPPKDSDSNNDDDDLDIGDNSPSGGSSSKPKIMTVPGVKTDAGYDCIEACNNIAPAGDWREISGGTYDDDHKYYNPTALCLIQENEDNTYLGTKDSESGKCSYRAPSDDDDIPRDIKTAGSYSCVCTNDLKGDGFYWDNKNENCDNGDPVQVSGRKICRMKIRNAYYWLGWMEVDTLDPKCSTSLAPAKGTLPPVGLGKFKTFRNEDNFPKCSDDTVCMYVDTEVAVMCYKDSTTQSSPSSPSQSPTDVKPPTDGGNDNNNNGGDSGDDNKPSQCWKSSAVTGELTFDQFSPFLNQDGGLTFPAGKYEVRYVGGCMKYNPSNGWTVNGKEDAYGWYITSSEAAGDEFGMLPGAIGDSLCESGETPGFDCGFKDYDACVKFSKNVPRMQFTLKEPSQIGVVLRDGKYSDNVSGLESSPTWLLSTCITD